ncbi:hypothetical protein CKN53_08905 [Acinetobacter baumannii]|nr:hypothetical protein [Acinetobacter baumannii]MBC6825768.1 hypothetical protein [Acinetobacter baumannii]PAX04712.1 hypothetical protein CKQ60_08100 [Acinetobacter baumannii]RKL56878.1 hypothetical protein CKN55_08275 [Acinetobacter baumannii]RLS19423.1 hypothetical protein CKN53_08905 [Acinetobacter baumannii]
MLKSSWSMERLDLVHKGACLMNEKWTYKEMMALRCAYNHGVRTPETRAAACLYVKLGRNKLLDQFKKESEAKGKVE